MLPWSYCSSQSSRFSVHSAQISVCHFLFLSLHCNVGYLFPFRVGIRIVLWIFIFPSGQHYSHWMPILVAWEWLFTVHLACVRHKADCAALPSYYGMYKNTVFMSHTNYSGILIVHMYTICSQLSLLMEGKGSTNNWKIQIIWLYLIFHPFHLEFIQLSVILLL